MSIFPSEIWYDYDDDDEWKNRWNFQQQERRRRHRSFDYRLRRRNSIRMTLPAFSVIMIIMFSLILLTDHVVNGVDGSNTTALASTFNETNTTMTANNIAVDDSTLMTEEVMQQQEEPIPECFTDSDCEVKFGIGSKCSESLRSRRCTNPYYHSSGCLAYHHPKMYQARQRICNSDDELYLHDEYGSSPPCQEPEIDYMEIRLLHQDWVSPIFENWIIQIILSEMLGIPTSIETMDPTIYGSFYDLYNGFDYYRAPDYFDSLRIPSSLPNGDCRDFVKQQRENIADSRDNRTSASTSTNSNYTACAHFISEQWDTYQSSSVQAMLDENIIETPQFLGVLAKESWAVTKFTLLEDPSLASYIGLQGEDNRQKLADTFLRPTTWLQYCELVSPDNCLSGDDGIAKRAPQNENEFDRMYVEGLYTGHFRKTDENDCELNPTNCTGHIADYPCGWTSWVESQAYYLNIPVESNGPEPGPNGYKYSQLVEMAAAANATRSNLLMYWWFPDETIVSYAGSDSEFVQLSFPTTTQECLDARRPNEDRCSSEFLERVGSNPAGGSCDDPTQQLHMIFSEMIAADNDGNDKQVAIHSPAYDTLKNFALTNVQVDEIFSYWLQDRDNPRGGVCRWVNDNLDYIVDEILPESYPRTLRNEAAGVDGNYGPIFYPAIIVAILSTICVLATFGLVYTYREKAVMKYSQIEFLYLLLVGSFCISVGSIFAASPPSAVSCIASTWLINFGYTMVLVPLCVKTAAINKLMTSAQSMRRVDMPRWSLFRNLVIICGMMAVYLVVWSILDTPRKDVEYHLTDEKEQLLFLGDSIEDDDSILSALGSHLVVEVRYYCSSRSTVWTLAAIAWNAFLLFIATILAYQSRDTPQMFNESQMLGFMIYSNGVFVVLRAASFALSGSVNESALERIRSLVYSADTMATIVIYFLPKIVSCQERLTMGSQSMFMAVFMPISTRRRNLRRRPRPVRTITHSGNPSQPGTHPSSTGAEPEVDAPKLSAQEEAPPIEEQKNRICQVHLKMIEECKASIMQCSDCSGKDRIELAPLLGGCETTPCSTGNDVVDVPNGMESTAAINSNQILESAPRSGDSGNEQGDDFEQGGDFESSTTLTV